MKLILIVLLLALTRTQVPSGIDDDNPFIPNAYKLSRDDIIKTAQGFLEGASSEINADQFAPCIKANQFSAIMATAISQIALKDSRSIQIGLSTVSEALMAIPDAIEQCKLSEQESLRLAALLNFFENPSSFVFQSGKDIIVNGVQVYDDIKEAFLAYNRKNFQLFGLEIAQALSKIALGPLRLIATPKTDRLPKAYSLTDEDILKVLIGVLEGVGAEANATSIVPCIKDSYSISAKLAAAIQDFVQKDEEHIKEGLKLLGEAIEAFPDAMTECQAAVSEAQRLYQMIANFKSPSSFVWHLAKDLIVNGVQIFEDISAAQKAYQANSWETFGYDIGHALAEVFLGSVKYIVKRPNFYLLDINTVTLIFEGVLEGVGAETNATDIAPCVKDSITVSSLLGQAIQDFAQKDEEHIKEGLKLLGEAIESLPEAMTECQAAAPEIERIYQMIANFKSPASFVWHVAKDLIVNGVQIYKDISAAQQAYSAQSWESFGFDVGHALAEVFVGSKENIVLAPKVYFLDVNQVEEIFLGVLEGVGAEANATDIVPCIKDAVNISSLLGQAIEAFAQKDEEHVKEGLKLLGEAIESLPDAMTECQAAVPEAEKLYQMIANFKSPASFAWHVAEDLIVNGVQIYQDIDGAIKAYQGQSWETFGFDVGHALAEVFIGSPSKTVRNPDSYLLNSEQILQIFIGVLEGVGAEANATDIAPCIKDSTTISGLLAAAIQDFAKKDEESIKEGLALLGQAVEALPDAMTECQAAVTEAERIYQMIANFKSPASFVWHVAKDLVVNGVQIYKDITAAQADYKAQSWEPFGYNVGNALAEVFLGSSMIRVPATFLLSGDQVVSIFVGVLEGVGSEANMTDVIPCITEAESISALLAQAVIDFAAKDEESIKAGLKLLGEAIEKLPDAMTQCSAAVSEAESLYEMIKNFKSPASFAWHVAKDLVVNGVQIFSDINGAVKAYDSQEWQLFGYDTGHALAEVFLGQREKAKSKSFLEK